MNRKSRSFIMVLLAVVFLLGINLAAEASPVILEIPAEVEIAEGKFSLLDLGTVSGGTAVQRSYLAEISLGAAPLAGRERILTRKYLQFLLDGRKLGQVIQLHMGEQVLVRTEGTCFTALMIETAIKLKLAQAETLATERWVELRNLPETIWLTKGNWRIEVELAEELPVVGTTLFKVIFISEEEPAKIVNISGKLRAKGKVWRSRKNLPRHSSLLVTDFEMVLEELKTGAEHLGPFPENHRNISMVRVGDVLQDRVIQEHPLVAKNSQVTVLLKDGPVELRLLSEAKSDGWQGDLIKLTNLDSKQGFMGRVIGKGLVEVLVR